MSRDGQDQIVPRINFNGLKHSSKKNKKGGLSSSISNLSASQIAEMKENFEGIMSDRIVKNETEVNANLSDDDKDGGTSNTFDIEELRDVVRDNFMSH